MTKKEKEVSAQKSKLRQVRVFSDTFKRQKVQELDSGLITVPELSKLYKVSVQSIYRWLHKYSINHQKGIRQVVQMESEAKKTKQLLERVAELERVIGQKQLHIDYLEMLVQISSEELNVDLKKNFDTKCCPTSKDCLDQKDLS
jgi:transposase-like protein